MAHNGIYSLILNYIDKITPKWTLPLLTMGTIRSVTNRETPTFK